MTIRRISTPQALACATALLFALGFGPTAALAQAGDAALFSTSVPPNVVLLVDNSGSMEHIVWHPMYDPAVTPTCRYWDDTTQYYIDPDSSDTYPSGSTDTTFHQGTYAISSPGCVTTAREIFDDPAVSVIGNPSSSEETRWMGHYLNWYYSTAADPYVAEIVTNGNGGYSACVINAKGLTPPNDVYSLYRRSRITAAKVILQEVICQVNAAGEVRFGLAQFRRGGDPNGGYITVPVNDYFSSPGTPNVYTLNGVSASHGNHLDTAINKLTGEAWTPLGESLFQIYTYFMDRTTLPPGATSGTFPAYQYSTSTTSGDGGPNASSGVPGSPVQFACQKNFVIVITDGEPTMDDFDTTSPTNTAVGFSNYGNLIGDFNADGETETGYPSEGALFLDDIAKFMHETDFRPDIPAHNGVEQTLDIYTVGFTTSPAANALLGKTALMGNGQFYFSNDPGKLATDIVDAVSDIVQKSQSFTAATVPAARTAAGGKFYTSLFVPSDLSGYWEGHLKAWQITSGGKILDKFGACALADPLAPTECSTGAFLSAAQPYWDAGNRLTNFTTLSTRRLYTSINPSAGNYQKSAFTAANMTPALLDITVADIPSFSYAPHPTPADANALRDVLVANVRGCELGDTSGTCTKRPWLLGDIFHSDPVVVPGPFAFLSDGGHDQFRTLFGQRQRVIVAGANDGFLRLFDAGLFDTVAVPPVYLPGSGDEIAGFAPYTARKKLKELPRDSGVRDHYFMDGPASVADVWFYTSPTNNAHLANGSEWRTISVAGMRQGGRQLLALDITKPANAGLATACPNTRSPSDSGYPCYLWEFPREDAPASLTNVMGLTFSQPVVTKIKVKVNANDNGGAGFDRWVAIFGTGYDVKSDPNNYVSYDALATEGRGLVVLDLQTGQIIAMKQFDATSTPSSATDPTTVTYDALNPERSMHFGFAATPGVYDLDDDGYADVVYAPDIGGNIWKWKIRDLAVDSVHSATPDFDQSAWEFSLFFKAPTYLDSGTGQRWYKSFFFNPAAVEKSGNLWLSIGSGERMDLLRQGLTGTTAENNRFYAIIERDAFNASGIAAPLTEADLTDLSANTGCSDVAASYDGFYFIASEGEKFVTETDIFFYVALAASYVPTVTTSPCDTGGIAKLYAFKVYCGQGLFTDPGTGNPAPSVVVGAGMPTAPQVTITTDPNGQSKIVINNQDGELIDPRRPRCTTPPCPPPPCQGSACPSLCPLPCGYGKGAGQLYWREF